MNLALWIVAGLLAAVLLLSSAKLFVPRERMAGMGGATRWVEDFSPGHSGLSEPLSSSLRRA